MKNGVFLIGLLIVAAIIFLFIFWDGLGSRTFDKEFREVQSRTGSIAEPALNSELPASISLNQAATNDAVRKVKIGVLSRALSVYYAQRQVFPQSLQVMLEEKRIAITDLEGPGFRREDFHYYPYAAVQSNGVPYGDCILDSSIPCKAYHLGVNMQDVSTLEQGRLLEDTDAVSVRIDGFDGDGCGHEVDRACYDIVGVQ